MSVKWHGCKSVPRTINGGGPAGATLGILEYLSQSSESADFVPPSDRFKFVEDLSILEIVNLLTIGISSYNIKQHIPIDIPMIITIFYHKIYNLKISLALAEF